MLPITKETNYIIALKDGSYIKVSESEYNQILMGKANKDEGFILSNKSFYAFVMVAKMLSEEDFYNQHPDKRPVELNSDAVEIDEFLRPIKKVVIDDLFIPLGSDKERRINAIRQIIKGLQQQIKQTSLTPAKQQLLNQMEARIKAINAES